MENFKRPIGVHTRLHSGLQDVVQAVVDMDLSVVQSFLMTESNEYISMSDKIFDNFVHAKKKNNFLYFVHAAYWSGLTNIKSKMFASLYKEVEVAQTLQSDGIVIHVGAHKKGISSKDQPKYVAESINSLHQSFPNISLVLENSPHAGKSFGGDIEELAQVLEHVEHKDQVAFCIDTAHAFVFGYDLVKESSRKDFLQLVDDALGSYVKLLHFNDSVDGCGSYIDKHEEPGMGLIGQAALKDMMHYTSLKDVPLIMELPGSLKKDEKEVLKIIASWDNN